MAKKADLATALRELRKALADMGIDDFVVEVHGEGNLDTIEACYRPGHKVRSRWSATWALVIEGVRIHEDDGLMSPPFYRDIDPLPGTKRAPGNEALTIPGGRYEYLHRPPSAHVRSRAKQDMD